jgi:PHP family Zn ribbon phosphoesterase
VSGEDAVTLMSSTTGETRFKAACPQCRTSFELTSAALLLAIGASARTTFYSFTCPDCGESVRKPAGSRIVELLTDGGVRTMRVVASGR